MKIIAMEAENQRLLSVHKRMVKSPNNRTKNNANLILPFMYLRTFKFNNQEIDTLKEGSEEHTSELQYSSQSRMPSSA